MFLIFILFVALIAWCKLNSDNRDKVMDAFCNVECKKDLKNKYKPCC